MRLKDLRGLPVIDPTAARKIGTVADYQVDPASGRLAAIDIDGVQEGDNQRIMAQRVRRVGHSAVILTARGGSTAGTATDINERWLDSTTLVGLEVMGDDGNRVGRLTDALFNQDSLEIDSYQLRGGGWASMLGRGARIQPSKVHACSRELMMVTTGRVKELAPAGTESSLDSGQTLSLRVPLKSEDRLPAPSFDAVPEAHPVAAHSS